MYIIPLLPIFLAATTATAIPLDHIPRQYNSPTPSPFYLVTTTQPTPSRNFSTSANVSATSLFNPYNEDTLYLRQQSAPYASLPNFTLTDSNQLSATSYSARNRTFAAFHSASVVEGEELAFRGPGVGEADGELTIRDGYLLGVGEETEGWSVCPGVMGEDVVVWKGRADGCEKVWVGIVAEPPY